MKELLLVDFFKKNNKWYFLVRRKMSGGRSFIILDIMEKNKKDKVLGKFKY